MNGGALEQDPPTRAVTHTMVRPTSTATGSWAVRTSWISWPIGARAPEAIKAITVRSSGGADLTTIDATSRHGRHLHQRRGSGHRPRGLHDHGWQQYGRRRWLQSRGWDRALDVALIGTAMLVTLAWAGLRLSDKPLSKPS